MMMRRGRGEFLGFALLVGALMVGGVGCGFDGESEGDIGGEAEESQGEGAGVEETGGGGGGGGGGEGGGSGGGGGTNTSVDGVAFSSLQWTFGGVKGGGAALSAPRLSHLRCTHNTLTYKWVVGLNAWGFAHSDAGAICAAFVKKSDGRWVGGKFDWVSTSRSSRSLGHILSGYGGWSLEGVPNPCQICYVVVDARGKRRSNVVGPTTWSR